MTEAGIEVGAARDLFAALGDETRTGALEPAPAVQAAHPLCSARCDPDRARRRDRGHRSPLSRACRGACRPGDRAGFAMKFPVRFLVPAIAFAGLVGFFLVGLQRDPSAIPSPLIGKPAPAFSLESLSAIPPGRWGLRILTASPGS